MQPAALATQDGYNVKGGMVGGTLGYNWQVSNFVVGFEGDLLLGRRTWQQQRHRACTCGARGRRRKGQPSVPELHQGNLAGHRARPRRICRQQSAVLRNRRLCRCGRSGRREETPSTSATPRVNDSTRSGWTAGGGLEWGFAPNWSTKFEWLYMKFEDKPLLSRLLADGTAQRGSVWTTRRLPRRHQLPVRRPGGREILMT